MSRTYRARRRDSRKRLREEIRYFEVQLEADHIAHWKREVHVVDKIIGELAAGTLPWCECLDDYCTVSGYLLERQAELGDAPQNSLWCLTSIL